MPVTKVIVPKNLPLKEGRKKVYAAAKRKGHGDARGVTYDPKTGIGRVV